MILSGTRVAIDPVAATQVINHNLSQAQSHRDCLNAFEDLIALLEHEIFGTSFFFIPNHSSTNLIRNAMNVYLHTVPSSSWSDILGTVYRTWGSDITPNELNLVLAHKKPTDEDLYQILAHDNCLSVCDLHAGTGTKPMSSCYYIETLGGADMLKRVEITLMDNVQIRAQICAIQIAANFVLKNNLPQMVSVYLGDVLYKNKQTVLFTWRKKQKISIAC